MNLKRFFKSLSPLFLLIVLTAFSVCSTGYANSDQKSEYVDFLFKVLKKELRRNIKKLKMRDYNSPYFIAYRISDVTNYTLSAEYGGITQNSNNKYRIAYVEVRVGNYKFDNTSYNGYGLGSSIGENKKYYTTIEDVEASLRHSLWLLSDISYKEAINQYMKKRGMNIFKPFQEGLVDFTKEKRVEYIEKPVEYKIDTEKIKSLVKKTSEIFKDYRNIIDSQVYFDGRVRRIYFINSEGTKIFTQQPAFYLRISARARAEDGLSLENFKTFFVISPENIPDEKMLIDSARKVAENLTELQKAPLMEPYSGPAILSSQVAGVLFHEVLGHRLEGERQRSEREGRTFAKKIGEKILPEFISVIDDPTLREFNGIPLAGFYKYDDEGVKAQRVELVEKGILKNYLTSRTPPKGFRKSNGHGRASDFQKPMGRMGNLIIKSKNEHSYDELKNMLLKMLKKQGKEYGFILKKARGGETNTSSYGFQAFKATPVLVYKIYAKDGKEELIRGVEIVGTPLVTLNKIIATGNDYGVFNGYCGAESGFIPVSTVAPSILVSEIELQRTSQNKKRPPILPPPY